VYIKQGHHHTGMTFDEIARNDENMDLGGTPSFFEKTFAPLPSPLFLFLKRKKKTEVNWVVH
jgi:hypothetical protein